MKFLFISEKPSITACKSNTASSASESGKNTRDNEAGFTLVEVTIALIVLLISLLGVFVSFTYAINYNAGNNSRAQALVVLQQEVERLRSAKFTQNGTDSALTGGIKAPRPVTAADGNRFVIQTEVDNDPNTDGIQGESIATTLKEITVTVTLESPTPGWQMAIPAKIVLRRVRGN